MKKKVRNVLILILAVIFLGSLAMLLRQWGEYREGQDIYAQAMEAARPAPDEIRNELPSESEDIPQPGGEPEISEEPEFPLEDISVAALQKKSRDVVGWIEIPGTALSYPLMQGEDNDYYLTHAWNGWETIAGSIFMDYQCASDFSDFNTIIYGHRMKDSSMFSTLKGYNKLSFREEYPWVYIKDAEGLRQYEIFAAYEAPVRSSTYKKGVPDEAARQEVIDFALEQSVINTGVIPTADERILTLSTCTGKGYDSRWVVQAVERINP